MEIEEQVSWKQVVEEILSMLSEEQKKLIEEVYWKQKSHEQIAKKRKCGEYGCGGPVVLCTEQEQENVQ